MIDSYDINQVISTFGTWNVLVVYLFEYSVFIILEIENSTDFETYD